MSAKAKAQAKALKTKPAAKAAAKTPAKAATLSKKGAAPVKAAKQAKGEIPLMDPNAPVVDLEELEEAEAEAASARAGGGGADAALAAAAAGTGEVSTSFKNFRHHPDMENFYRFIFENDLRHEAVAILDKMQAERALRKSVKFAKGQAH